jgi:hypothetical protein
MTLTEVHGRLASTALYYTIIMAVWALFRFFRRQEVDSSYWGGLVIGEVLYLAQGALGAFLFFTGRGVLGNAFMHILYGVVAVLVPPALFVWTRGDETPRAALVYGVGFLFLMGILLRSMATGAG